MILISDLFLLNQIYILKVILIRQLAISANLKRIWKAIKHEI